MFHQPSAMCALLGWDVGMRQVRVEGCFTPAAASHTPVIGEDVQSTCPRLEPPTFFKHHLFQSTVKGRSPLFFFSGPTFFPSLLRVFPLSHCGRPRLV